MDSRASFVAVFLLTSVAACAHEAPDRREWRPSDHDRTDEELNSRPGRPPAAANTTTSSAQPLAQGEAAPKAAPTSLADVVWRTQCASCHGLRGHGDGPQGPLVQAPDLTRADWQARTSDAEIATTITNGRNRMPKFDLPSEVVTELVKRIRSMRGG